LLKHEVPTSCSENLDAVRKLQLLSESHWQDLPFLTATQEGQSLILTYGANGLSPSSTFVIWQLRRGGPGPGLCKKLFLPRTTPLTMALIAFPGVTWFKKTLSIRRHANTCCVGAQGMMPEGHWHIPVDLIYKVMDIERGFRLRDTEPSIDQIFARFRSRNATDPRDKIYAFLSLAPPRQSRNIEVDYGIEPAQLYTDVAWKTFQLTQSFDFLSQTDFQDNNASAISVPSWVPNLSVSMRYKRRDYQGGEDNPIELYGACISQPVEATLKAQGVISIRGYTTSLITRLIAPFLSDVTRDRFILFSEWI
jgi:hypothetical protein